MCDRQEPKQDHLRQHLTKDHALVIEEVTLNFQTFEEFENWRYEMQNSTMSEYVKFHATKVLACGWEKTVLQCSRSLRSRGKLLNSNDRKRATKKQGTKKVGKFCPSAIEVIKKKRIYFVKYWKTHCGHKAELDHLRIPKKCRDEIAGKLKEGVSFQRIIDDINNGKMGSDSRRMSLFNRHDLHNIIRDYNLPCGTKLNQDDSESVQLCLKESPKKNSDITLECVKHFAENGSEFDAIELEDSNMDVDNVSVTSSKVPSTSRATMPSVKRLKKKLLYCATLLDKASPDLKLDAFEKSIDKLIAFARSTLRLAPKRKINPDSKTEIQRNIFVKKKGKSTESYSRATYQEVLSQLNQETQNVNTGYDHTYHKPTF